MYKIGDLVRIKKREGDSHDYPLYYVEEMLKFEGDIAKIIGVNSNFMQKEHFKCSTFDGDINTYFLDIDGQEFLWSSPMLEPYVTNPYFVDLNNILR